MDDRALQGFVALSKSTRGRATAALIHKAVAKPGVFYFGELLEQPSVQALRGTDQEPALKLLELFAYGTYDDWKADEHRPKLNGAQLLKLKQLTIVTMASSDKTLPYDDLQTQLDERDVRSLEDLVISCIYGGLIDAKLNQRSRLVHIASAMGRDVQPSAIPSMIKALENWNAQSEALVAKLDETIQKVQRRASKDATASAATSKLVEERKTDARAHLRRNLDVPSSAFPASSMSHAAHPHVASMARAVFDDGYHPDEATRRGRPKRRHAQVTSNRF